MKRKTYGLIAMILLAAAIVVIVLVNRTGKSRYFTDENAWSGENHFYISSSTTSFLDDTMGGSAASFEGFNTIWYDQVEEAHELVIHYHLKFDRGAVKLVLIPESGKPQVLLEQNSDAFVGENPSITVSLEKGYNEIKLVGKNVSGLEYSFETSEGELRSLGELTK